MGFRTGVSRTIPLCSSSVAGLLGADVKIEQESFNGVGAELANVDRDAVNQDPARHEHPDTRDARDDGCHLLELGRQEVDEGREFERHEVASGRRSVAGTFGGEQFLEPVEERVMEGDPAAR